MSVTKANMFSCTSTSIASSSSVRRPESKDTNLKKSVLLNTESKSTPKDVKKSQNPVSLVVNKHDTMNLNAFESNVNVLKPKTINAVNDGSNLVCVSCGKDVFMLSHDKCVARYALSLNFLECSKHMTGNLKLLRNLVEKFMGIVCFSNDNFVAITRYGDYVQGDLTICHGGDLLTGSCDSNLYTISISKMSHQEGFTLASECNNLGPALNYLNFQESSKELNEIPSKEDLDNLFGPLYEEYYATRTLEVSDNFTTNTLDNEDTSSSSSIIIEDHDAPQIVSSSEKPIANEPSTPVFNNHSDEQVQEDIAQLDGNTFINPFVPPEWTKSHSTEQVISDPSKPVTTRSRLHTDVEICMYTLTVLVERHANRNVIKVKWLGETRRMRKTVIWNKSRLVAKGYSQQEGIDFEESFASVA
ncbi:hypothetical protein Tco_0706825 [Tanacetum coccineum]|uniref:Reverse transcriptase Ty1/copia-type domain-containing protein n=1 Tax=Tanacetum coccineum TaxID=301880 RepID=A0ABQ4Y8H0_9ASTR